MANPSQVIVLIEGKRDEQFIRGYLRNCGIDLRNVRTNSLAYSKGSGEQHVRLNYPKEVGAYRQRHAGTALIVMIDADGTTLQSRLAQLEAALNDSDQRPIQPRERVAHLIPKRNLETWILCLNGENVNEETDYKRGDDWTEKIRSASLALFQWTRATNELPVRASDSLGHGVRELKRVDL